MLASEAASIRHDEVKAELVLACTHPAVCCLVSGPRRHVACSCLFQAMQQHDLQQKLAQVRHVCQFSESLQTVGQSAWCLHRSVAAVRHCLPSISLRKSLDVVPFDLPDRCPTASPINLVILYQATCLHLRRDSVMLEPYGTALTHDHIGDATQHPGSWFSKRKCAD